MSDLKARFVREWVVPNTDVCYGDIEWGGTIKRRDFTEVCQPHLLPVEGLRPDPVPVESS